MKAKYIFSALAAVAMIGCNKTEKVAAPEFITVSTDIQSKVSTNARVDRRPCKRSCS